MTCIVAIPDGNGGVIVGGDSAGVAGRDLVVRSDAKVFINGPFAMGFTSSFRMGQLLRYNFSPPDHPSRTGDVQFMTTVFVDAVRSCLAKGGWKKKEHEREEGGTFLVGYRGKVYEVEGDFQVAIPAAGYAACGCGAQAALGSLHATEQVELSPDERVMWALDAAEELSAGVRRPFVTVTSEADE